MEVIINFKKTLVHIGWITDSLKTINAHIESGFDVKIINTQPGNPYNFVPEIPSQKPVDLNLYEGVHSKKIIFNKLVLGFLNSSVFGKSIKDRLEKASAKIGTPDFIFGNWGVGVLYDIALIKKIETFKEVPVILNMETFPTSWDSKIREYIEIKSFKNLSEHVDGFVIPTQKIKSLITQLKPELKEKSFFETPFFYPESYSGNYSNNINNEVTGDLIFIGQLDYSRSLNDVRSQLIEMADSGLSVYCHSKEPLENSNIHQFSYFDGGHLLRGEMANYLRSFKACIVTYNFENANALRFDTSLPSRFLLAVQSGVPIALPRGRFCAMEEFVIKHDIGILYDSPSDLYNKLNSSTWSNFKSKVQKNAYRFIFDGTKWRNFVNEVLRKSA